MTCQERVELMQRYLDHDLSDAEQLELMEHLQQCGECSGLFERLRLLDSELSKLPKVTPAFSLVDAILPQLAELDRLPGTLEETAAKEPAATAPVGGIPWTRRVFATWKVAGGVAVAAAMIGIFIMKEQNLLTPSVAMKSADSRAAESSKRYDAKPAAGTAATAGGEAGKKDSGQSLNGNAPKADAKITDQSVDKAKSSAQASANGSGPATGGPSGTSPQAKEPNGQTSADNNRVAISASPIESSPGSKEDQKPASISSSGDANAGANPSQPAASPKEAPNPAAPNPAAAKPADGSNAGSQPAQAPHFKGITADPPQNGQFTSLAAPTPAPATLKSPDGKMVASVEELKVVVRQTDTGATVTTSTYSWAETDVISLVGFSEDGKLTYHVQHQNGADDVTLDTAAKTETKTPAGKN